MPAINPGSGPSGTRKPKPRPKPKPAAPVVRNADTGDRARSRPAPKITVQPVFKGPATVTKPFAPQRQQARQQVRTARRNLPAPALAQPPIVTRPKKKAKAGGEPMKPAQVQIFLRSQSKTTQAARKQIVGSIRTQVNGLHGSERVAALDRLVDEIATDPRLSGTRKAIRHYTALERETARPQTTDTIKRGKPPKVLKAGIGPNINISAIGDTVGKTVAAATPSLQGNKASQKFVKAALSDIAHLPLMVPQTAYEISRATIDLAQGDTKRAKEILHGLTEGVIGNLVTGDFDGALKYAREHPVFAALEVRGGKGVTGRGTGAVMRSGAVGQRAKRAASTRRADIKLSGEGAKVADRQHYSADVFTKALQVAVEKRRGEGKTVMRDHRLRRRADFESDTAAATSRGVRQDEAVKANRTRTKTPLDAVVGLVVQGVVRSKSLEADLRKELARLDHAHATADFSTGAQKRQNRTTADAIRSVLRTPAAMSRLGELAQSGRANVRAINDLEGQAVAQSAITPERAERAKLFPAAQAHLDAEYSDGPFRAARGREVAAGRALRREATVRRQNVAKAKVTEAHARDKVKSLAARHKSDRAKEGHNRQIAAYYVGTQRFDLLHQAAAYAKANGITPKDIRRVATTRNEAKRTGEMATARRAVDAAVKRRRTAEAHARALNAKGSTAPARKAFDDARGERQAAQKGGTKSLNVAGKQISDNEIRVAVGLSPDDVAYLPHHTQNRGARAHYQTAFAGRKNLDSSEKRTGSAFEKGAVDVSHDAVKEHRVRVRGVINRIAEHDRIINSIATTLPRTPQNPHGMMTWDQAEKIASNAADNGVNLVPYRVVPGSYDQARMAAIVSRQDAGEIPDLDGMIGAEFAARLKAPPDRSTPNVVLVPEQIINQLLEQQKVSSAAGKAGNVAADVFRRTVLPFSVKWLTGNIIEAGARLSAVAAGPNAWRIGRSILRELDKIDSEQAIRVKAGLTGGLLYGNRGLTVRRLNEHFAGTALEKPAALASAGGQLPVVKHLGWLMKRFTDGVFAFNRVIESNAQVAALGKWAKRDMQEMTGSWMKATRAQERALQDMARGLTDTKNVHDAARYIDQTLGQYSRFSPAMRRMVQSATPFLPWYVNAARFVAWTLPAKHPIKTGLYTLVAQNLQDDFDASHGNLPPGDLRGEVVTDDGTILPVGRFLPTSLFTGVVGGGNEQLTGLVDPFFPQFKSAALAAFGLNFSGHQAKLPPQDRGQTPGTPGAVRATMAFNALLEAFVPAVGIGKRVREGGSTGYDNSTLWDPKTKPGTKDEVGELLGSKSANRILNPVRPVSGIKGTPRTTAAPAAPEVSDDPLDALDDAVDDAALDEIDAALDIIP